MKNSLSLILVSALVLVGVVAITSYGAYKFLNKDEIDEVENVEKLGKELYEKTLEFTDIDRYMFYSDTSLTFDSIKNKVSEFVFENIDKSKIGKNNNYDNAKCDWNSNDPNIECFKLKINKEDYDTSFYDLFGPREVVYNSNFEIERYFCIQAEDDGNIYCNANDLDLEQSAHVEMLEYVSTKKDKEDIVITVKGLSYNMGSYAVFSDLREKKLLQKFSKDEFKNILKTELFKKFEGKTSVFKVRFKKSNEGYYWHSTELQ